MGEPFAVNASPLIFLAQAGLPDLLRLVNDTRVVPQAVVRELEAGARIHDAARVVHDTGWLKVTEVGETPESMRLWDLGNAESGVLAWVLSHPGTDARLAGKASLPGLPAK